ncbi:MAG: putative lipid II flippase FtsW [Gammaproteobacteria bacterium]|tara:strand:+ start:311 stop:1498 length:1188 start_codon:yes stop_codon:yes gene_type:complete
MNKINKQSLWQRIIFGELYRNYHFKDFDWGIIFSVFFFTLFGIVMVSSVSLPTMDGSFSITLSHLSKILIALTIFLLIFRFPISFWSKIDIQILLISFFLLFLVYMPIIGQEVNGANRWIRIFGFSLQPSELMKFALIIYISSYCSRRLEEFKEKWLGFWKPILVVVMAISLILFEPDLGSSAVIFVVALSIMFIAGAPMKHLLLIFSLGMSVFVVMILAVPWRMKRILSFMNPWETYQEEGWQLSHSLIAFGRGDWFGVGLGESLQKLHYLPDAQTDFIFAIIAEEMGLLFCILLVMLFSFLIFKCFYIGRLARHAQYYLGSYIAYGAGICIALHVFINIGVSSGMLPTKGITLPFISFGGTNLLLMFALVALVLRINFEISESFSNKNKILNV